MRNREGGSSEVILRMVDQVDERDTKSRTNWWTEKESACEREDRVGRETL